jgi:peptidoglycan/LPS O-acetylase OafA/YrhL
MKTLLNREGWIAVLTQVVAVVAWLLAQFLPAEYQEAVPYIVAAVEAIGMILIIVFVRQTMAQIARLKMR